MSRISSEQMRELLKVYFIMGSSNCEKDPLEVINQAIAGGITLFQFREKGTDALTGGEKLSLAKKIQSICKENDVPFIVNDDVELALLLDADGVHIGQDDESAEAVRKKIGDKILGVSAHNVEEARKAIEQGADYIGVGPIFPTITKEDAQEVKGTALVKLLRKNGIDIPMVGIGGITGENAASVIAAGADGVSVITAISMADDVEKSAIELREQVETAG